MINLILAEDHTLVRAGIRALLEKEPDICIVGEASDGQQAIELLEQLEPQVIIMDIMMPRLNGLQAVGKMNQAKMSTRVVLLSMYSDQALVSQAMKQGVLGYVLKTSLGEELIAAVRAVARGETYLSKEIDEKKSKKEGKPAAENQDGNQFEMLSPREKEILKLVAEENTSLEIGKLLCISEKTVEKHRASIMNKLSVRNIAGLVRVAYRNKLIELEN